MNIIDVREGQATRWYERLAIPYFPVVCLGLIAVCLIALSLLGGFQ